MLVRRLLPLLPALVLLVGGCSPPAPPGGPGRPSSPGPTGTAAPSTPTPSPAPTPGAARTPSAAPGRFTVPLALVVHVTRPVRDVPVNAARRVVSEGGDRWSEVGQPGRRMRVLTTRDRSAGDVLRAVRASRSVLGILPADRVDPTVRVLTVGRRHPLRDPARYPLEVAAGRKVPPVTTLAAVGDIMLGRRVGQRHAADPSAPLRPLARRLARADLTLGNVESTLSRRGSPTQGGDSFAASPRVLTGLRAAGFDVIQVANNHLGDFGDRALRETLRRYAQRDLPTVGAGRNLAAARRPVVLERNGVRVGFYATESIGETPAATRTRAGTNRLNMPPRTGPLDRTALRRVSGDIRALARRVDVVVVLSHWGTQYTHRPEPSQRIAARAFARAGADLVIGGHPHWVQGFERVGDTVIVHSLGNFVFDMDFQVKTREGVFLEVVLWGDEVKAVEPVPYVIDRDFTPRPVSGSRARGILGDLWGSSRSPFAVP